MLENEIRELKDHNKRVAILCCPYSGSKYTAKWFNENDVKLGWEKDDEAGQVNWKLTFDEKLEDYDAVWHLVRNPLRCVSSLKGLGKWKKTPLLKDNLDVEIVSESSLTKAMRVYIEMNRRAESMAEFRFQVESLYSDKLSTSINTKTDVEYEWSDLMAENKELAGNLMEMGRRYGYKIKGA